MFFVFMSYKVEGVPDSVGTGLEGAVKLMVSYYQYGFCFVWNILVFLICMAYMFIRDVV